MNTNEIIERYYQIGSLSYDIITTHGRCVADKAVKIAKNLGNDLDLVFIEEAAMLHDIGIFMTDMQGMGCGGNHDYMCHGILGRELLEKEGYPKHALVCERHTGVGLTIEDIEKQKLPLPKREMVPITLEEKIICFSDCFFSKDPKNLTKEKTIEEIIRYYERFGEEKAMIFKNWCQLFLKIQIK